MSSTGMAAAGAAGEWSAREIGLEAVGQGRQIRDQERDRLTVLGPRRTEDLGTGADP